MRSLYDAVDNNVAVRPTTITGTGTPVAAAVQTIDTFGYNTGLIGVHIGSPTGTPISYTVAVQVQECATSNGTFTDASGIVGTATGTTTSNVVHMEIRLEGLGTSRLRYLKITPVVTMTPNSGSVLPISAHVVLGRAFQEPVSNSNNVTG